MVARDFESPADADNVYEAILVAIDADDVPSAVQFAVTVTDVQEVVALTISGLYDDDFNPEHVSARQTARVSPEPIGALTWTLAGADASLFELSAHTDPVRQRVDLAEQDFENPRDADRNNVYEVTVKATDEDQNTAEFTFNITIVNEYEPPVGEDKCLSCGWEPPPPTELVPVAVASRRFDVDARTIRRWIDAGVVRGAMPTGSGRVRLVDVVSVADYIAA